MLKYILLVSFFLGISSDAQACCPCFRAKDAPIAPMHGMLSPGTAAQVEVTVARGASADAVYGSRFEEHPDFSKLRDLEDRQEALLTTAEEAKRAGALPSQEDIQAYHQNSVTARELREKITRDLQGQRK